MPKLVRKCPVSDRYPTVIANPASWFGCDSTKSRNLSVSISHVSVELFMRLRLVSVIYYHTQTMALATIVLLATHPFMKGWVGPSPPTGCLLTWQEGPSEVHVSVLSTRHSMTRQIDIDYRHYGDHKL